MLHLLAPPPDLSISAWADAHRYLSPEASAEPGRWSTGRAEYQREIMDAISDPTVERVVAMTSSQVGKTEICLNAVGYHVAQDPAPMLVVMPTLETAAGWSNERLAPMLRTSPQLAEKISDRARDGSNTIYHKTFPGGHLTLAGANSPASLAMRPIRILLCDEVDRYPASAGNEGDPVSLATKRTATFWNRKIVLVSSPTDEGRSRIAAAYDESDQRKFWVPCPDCGEHQILKFDHVRWDEGAPETARYACAHCGTLWSDQMRWAAVARGEWRAERPFAGTAGFWISELYSPWRKLSETVRDFLAAKDTPERLKTFLNTALAELWRDEGEAPDWQRLMERREPLLMGVVPREALVLTAGIDNQSAQGDQRLEMAVWAWAPGYESWLIDTKVFPGNPGSNGPWDAVAEALAYDYPVEGGGTMRIARAAADTGGQHTADIYAQIRRLHEPALIAVKGAGGYKRNAPISGPTAIDVTDRGVKIKRGLRLWTVLVDVYKAELYRRLHLKLNEDGTVPRGWVHLPQGLDPEAIKQLVAERLVTAKDKRGFAKIEWAKTRANEQLDMAIYARAALAVMGSDRIGERFWNRYRRDEDREAPPPPPREPDEVPTGDPVQLPPTEIVPTVTTHVRTSGRGSRYAR